MHQLEPRGVAHPHVHDIRQLGGGSASGRLQQHRRHLDEGLDLGTLGVGPIEPDRAHFQVVRRALLAGLAGGRQAGQAEHRENLQSSHVAFHSQLGAGTGPAPGRLTSRPTGEEVRRPENAEVLVGVVEAEVEALGGVLEAAAERQALEALLVVERRLRLVHRDVVRRLVGVAAPQRDAEVRAAQLVHGPLAAAGEAGPVVVGLVEVAEQGEPALVRR